MTRRPTASIPARCKRAEGQVIPLVALAMVAIIGFAGLVVDVARVWIAQRQLQQAVDAAALVAGQNLPNAATGYATAVSYSGAPGKLNVPIGYGVNGNPPVVTFECLSSAPGYTAGSPPTCTSDASNSNCKPAGAQQPLVQLSNGTLVAAAATTGCNAVHVTESAHVATTFAHLFLPFLAVKASSTVAARGGTPHPLDVMVVLDSTASMHTDSCSGSVTGIPSGSVTKEDCAKSGVQALLSQLWPCSNTLQSCGSPDSSGNVTNPLDEVGLMTYPALKNPTPARLADELDCQNSFGITTADIDYPPSPYPGYQIVTPRSDFRTSDTGPLNNNSQLMQAIYWSGPGCTGSWPASGIYGLEDPGGVGTYFADAITAATTALVNDGRTAQKVIILLSDGQANTGGPNNSKTPCQDAINAAKAAAGQGLWVYSIAYNSSGNCPDPSNISAVNTMKDIACSPQACPDPSKFFNQPSAGDLTGVFTQVAENLTASRIIPDAGP